MRDIKFRGLDLNSRKWVYGYYVNSWGNGKICNTDFGFRYVDKETVGQYTGLEDSAGQGIYEGDILKTFNLVGVVEFESPEFRLSKVPGTIFESEIIRFYEDIRPEDTKIIGNIHENPELLEEEDE